MKGIFVSHEMCIHLFSGSVDGVSYQMKIEYLKNSDIDKWKYYGNKIILYGIFFFCIS